MNQPSLAIQAFRALLYMAGGILPALGLALLSLLLLAGNKGWGSLLSLSAWLGTIGLGLALAYAPTRLEPRRTLFICALLMIGLVAMSPLLTSMLKDFGNARNVPVLSAAIAGPVLIAVHYIWRALLIFSASARRMAGLIFALIIGIPGLFYLIKPSPPEQIIHTTAQTDEITLIIERDIPELSPSMGLSYASKLPYSAIHYQGRTYKPLPAQARLSVPWDGTSSRYVIKESLQANSRNNEWPHQVIWTVQDQQTGQLMAERVLWRRGINEWSKDTPSGWQGDHAANFIRSVLKPASPPDKSMHGYPQSNFRLEEVPVTSLISLASMENRTIGCAAGIALLNDKTHTYLQSTTPEWRFESHFPIEQVFCIDSDIYVVSQLLPQDIYIDHLDTRGNLKGQFSTSAPSDLHQKGIRRRHISSLLVDKDELHLQLAFLKDMPKADAPVLANKQTIIHIDNRTSPDSPWTSSN
jgi:hypothetical protein